MELRPRLDLTGRKPTILLLRRVTPDWRWVFVRLGFNAIAYDGYHGDRVVTVEAFSSSADDDSWRPRWMVTEGDTRTDFDEWLKLEGK